MKNLLKLNVSLLICGLVILSGCGAPISSLPNKLAGKTGNYPKSINIIAPDFFKATGAANADQAKQQWLDEMSERYGVSFNIYPIHINMNSKNTSSSALNPETAFIGIVPVSTNSLYDLKLGIKRDICMPLEGYLADNPVWNALPENFKSLFEIDGHIYAIPTSISRVQNARIIHDEALQETGITVTDLASFHDFAVAYARKAGKGTGRGRSTGSYMMPDVMDIMNAFGLYPGNDQRMQFSYDPTADCYVDWLTKPAAASALEYLRELVNVAALSPADTNEVARAFDNDLFASTYDQYSDYDTCTEVLTLNSASSIGENLALSAATSSSLGRALKRSSVTCGTKARVSGASPMELLSSLSTFCLSLSNAEDS